MTRQEAEYVYGWLENSYQRNYRDADLRQKATAIDNLTKVFAQFSYADVRAEYERIYAVQKNEPHPSEVRANLMRGGDRRQSAAAPEVDPYEVLRKHPKYADMERAYGARAVRRAAKLCVETARCDELKFRIEHDTPCREGRFR